MLERHIKVMQNLRCLCHQVDQPVRNASGVGIHQAQPWDFRDARQHFLGDWVRRLLTDQPILIFGNGSQIRDFNYVDDVVAALLSAAAEPSTDGRVYNLGSDEPISLTDLAQTLIAVNGRGRIEYTPFPPDRQRIDIGDYHGDFTRIHAALAWAPTTSLRTGLASTLAFVNQQRAGYL